MYKIFNFGFGPHFSCPARQLLTQTVTDINLLIARLRNKYALSDVFFFVHGNKSGRRSRFFALPPKIFNT
jgi:hypothetical protein